MVSILTYDLKNVKPGDNERVKDALASIDGFYHTVVGQNKLAVFGQLIQIRLPNTTFIVDSEQFNTVETLVRHVSGVIKGLGIVPGEIFAAQFNNWYLLGPMVSE